MSDFGEYLQLFGVWSRTKHSGCPAKGAAVRALSNTRSPRYFRRCRFPAKLRNTFRPFTESHENSAILTFRTRETDVYTEPEVSKLQQSRLMYRFALGLLFSFLLFLVSSSVQAQNFPYQTGFEGYTPTNWNGWTASNGMWTVGTPAAGVGPGAAFDGSECAYAANYQTSDSSILQMPPITLPAPSTGSSPQLRFWQWFQFGGPNQFGHTSLTEP